MTTIFIVTGTRPEAIKLAPLILRLKQEDGFRVVHCHTCQHKALADDVFAFFGIGPDIRFGDLEFSGDLVGLFQGLMGRLRESILAVNPDWIVVQGDTQSALAGAMCGFYLGIPVAHVEAGLRSHKQFRPFPEEFNRRAIAHCSTLHFAPTGENVKQLLREGFDKDNIFLTGNTGIDALQLAIAKLGITDRGDIPHKQVLVTMHRRENIDQVMGILANAMRTVAAEGRVKFLVTLHPNPEVRSRLTSLLADTNHVTMTDPLPYGEFIRQMVNSDLLITDSGGIQEEAAHLGKKLLVCRMETERREGLKEGSVELLPMTEEGMVNAIEKMTTGGIETEPREVYGDGRAAERIVEVMRSKLGILNSKF